MIELENKINLFRGIVWGEAKAKSEKELYESTEKNTESLNQQRAELDKKKADYVERRRKAADFRSKSRISLQKEENKKALLEAKDKCLVELTQILEQRLTDYAKTDAYKKRLADDLKQEVGKFPDAKIQISPRDRKIAIDAGFPDERLEDLPDSEIGGYAITSGDGRRRRRMTLRATLEDNSYEIGRALYAVLDREKA